MLEKVRTWLKHELEETKTLFKCLPVSSVVFFVVSVIAMNLMASKVIVNDGKWLALDAGIAVSWVAFLTMDMIVKRFGPRAAIKVNLFAVIVNIVVMGMFTLGALLPTGNDYPWGLQDYGTGLNWWIIGASTAAFIVSGVVNSISGWAIKCTFKKNPNGVAAYITSSYISTTLGQFVDNLVFALIFTMPFDNLNIIQVLMFAVVGAVVELLCQIIFSPLGYKIAERWRKQNIGEEYITLVNKNNNIL